ncbi:MAG: tyrosine-type recombinase/integrase [Intestinimonas sp.]|jgi:integrase|nr:tyrosine-type recombinase/integrase [Intestinimonas sp.]
MTIKDYRAAFYTVLEAAGIDNPVLDDSGAGRHRLTPHSCRHTFATMMKRIEAPDADKLALIGHTSNEMLRHYQDVSADDLRKITDAL